MSGFLAENHNLHYFLTQKRLLIYLLKFVSAFVFKISPAAEEQQEMSLRL